MKTISTIQKKLSMATAGVAFIAVGTLSAGQVGAASTTFLDETDFLNNVTGLANLESFEDLVPDNVSSQRSSITVDDFTLSVPAPGTNLSVQSIPDFGQFATDGNNYVRNTEGLSMTFSFLNPVNFFGLNVIDWGDFADPATLTLSTDLGETFNIASTPTIDGNLLFFGLTSDIAFSTLTLNQPSTLESWAVDEVYYGVTASEDVPEPASVLSLLAFGVLGAGSAFKQKWLKHKASIT
ncbi:MAG: hypothetical protein F6K14_15600 [Symploca sp. SIO2C1]|nr:hypothetical protein [Symploca sp. SIO2C1]